MAVRPAEPDGAHAVPWLLLLSLQQVFTVIRLFVRPARLIRGIGWDEVALEHSLWKEPNRCSRATRAGWLAGQTGAPAMCGVVVNVHSREGYHKGWRLSIEQLWGVSWEIASIFGIMPRPGLGYGWAGDWSAARECLSCVRRHVSRMAGTKALAL